MVRAKCTKLSCHRQRKQTDGACCGRSQCIFTHVEAVTDYFVVLAAAEMETDRNALTYGTKWTPVKRLHAMRDSMPEEARSSVAWTGTLPLPSEPTPEMEEAAM